MDLTCGFYYFNLGFLLRVHFNKESLPRAKAHHLAHLSPWFSTGSIVAARPVSSDPCAEVGANTARVR